MYKDLQKHIHDSMFICEAEKSITVEYYDFFALLPTGKTKTGCALERGVHVWTARPSTNLRILIYTLSY